MSIEFGPTCQTVLTLESILAGRARPTLWRRWRLHRRLISAGYKRTRRGTVHVYELVEVA